MNSSAKCIIGIDARINGVCVSFIILFYNMYVMNIAIVEYFIMSPRLE